MNGWTFDNVSVGPKVTIDTHASNYLSISMFSATSTLPTLSKNDLIINQYEKKTLNHCLTLGRFLSYEWEKKLSVFHHTNVNTWHIKISFFNLIFITIDSNMLYLLLSFPNCALKLTHKSLSKSSIAINPTAVRFSLITNELLSCHRIAWAECLTD